MSVGESGAGSEGSEYEDEDEEFPNQQQQQQRHNNNRNSNSRDGAAALGLERGRAYDPLSRKLASRTLEDNRGRLAVGNHSLGQRRMERPASKENNPFFFLNSFPHQGSSHAAAAASTASAENGTIRDGHYYTSLLTGGSCFKSQHHEPSADQSLKQILSDPVSGELMDDALIFPCGHSFGSAGLQKIQETNLCHICQVPTRVSDGSINLALQAAVQAFRHDRGFPRSSGVARTAKRRRDPDGEQSLDVGRPKGVQFPYVVSDRVLIKGNKRTPERFVGKQAIITTQCLNGWYLVRTIDNGESVRLQYRSLQKIEDEAGWHHDPVAAEFASVDLSGHSVENS